MIEKVSPVILAGGQGKRLRPLSWPKRPKQFLPLLNGQTFFEAAIQRVSNPDIFHPPIIIGSRNHKVLIDQLIPQGSQVIYEPCPKNTAAAIALAVHASHEDDILLIKPADHVIPDIKAFEYAIQQARPYIAEDKIVTFGIKPTRAKTDYGYIQKGAGVDIVKFHEKPSSQDAHKYYKAANYLWNAGIFMAKASTLSKEFISHAPDILALSTSQDDFTKIKPLPFDTAIMEKTNNAVVILAAFEWRDIGTWPSLLSYKLRQIR